MGLNVEEGYFEGYDGAELFFQTWSRPDQPPSAVILGIHGLGEHSEAYRLLAEGLQGSPYQLIMSDLRGHGRSAGKRGVGSIDEYISDIKLFKEVVAKRFPKIPFFFLGHSMGGLVLTKLLIRNGDMGAKGAVLSSPLLGVALAIPPLKRKSANLLAKFLPDMTLDNEIPNEQLTHNKQVIKAYEMDTFRHNRVSPRLFLDMLASMDYVFANGSQLSLPLLMQQSGDDLIVSQKRAEEFFDTLKMQDKENIVYEGYFHEIYNEIWREKPYGDLIRWLNQHKT